MSKHTPGPWKANCINKYGDYEIVNPTRNYNAGAEAKARLIAAAPLF